MLIYIFAEHYPNPYKPQFDTEFAFLLRQGHDIKIFVTGSYMSTIHPRVREYKLDEKILLFPTTLKTLPKFSKLLVKVVLTAPKRSLKRAISVWKPKDSVKSNMLRTARAMLLPGRHPQLCYIHNIVTAEYVDFLRNVYPDARHAMYFHGGEVGGVRRVTRDVELFGAMDVVFTNTHFSMGQAVDRGCPPERVVPLPVGFDISDYPAQRDKKYRPEGILRLISIGRLSHEKGIIFALEGVALLINEGQKNIRYTIVGRGLEERMLKEYVKANSLEDYVTFSGEKDKAGVVNLLSESDVLLLPSVMTDTWAETQAAVVQEAMFMEVIVVGTRAGGVPESTADVMKEFSVPVGNADAIASAIKIILALPEEKIRSICKEAREFAVKKFDINHIGVIFLEKSMSKQRTVE
ncbi:glycosyltransferase family 4 protein [Geomonas agri]|uniref:glycosyltransferase family 4 protein n=1 Tax=Geomonas agri TaxID=2873702 RepID=UPI001CD41560|nr:glycosyltransferase family 4 protein [Geomonas agri]